MANKVGIFFKDIKLEMAKVSWPTKDELVASTAIVLVSLAILSAPERLGPWSDRSADTP